MAGRRDPAPGRADGRGRGQQLGTVAATQFSRSERRLLACIATAIEIAHTMLQFMAVLFRRVQRTVVGRIDGQLNDGVADVCLILSRGQSFLRGARQGDVQ